MMRGRDKITKDHLSRRALVYIRQSTQFQVRHNLQSQERQYQLEELASGLGWGPDNIEVLDEDLGSTASISENREGFDHLRRQVAEGHAGIIFCVEASRLARNNRDWYHLLDLCGICGTLVAEPGAVYDPRDYEDRMHMGLKGILSEAELHLLRTRLSAGLRLKAQKGELITRLPIGFVQDSEARVVLDPDENVRHTVATVFKRFREFSSVLKVLKWMLGEGLKMPKRVGSGLFSEVVWQRPTYRALHRMLTNPTYAGAYSYGRRRHFLRIIGEEPRRATRELPMDQWNVLIQDAHAGYISWEEYLRNRERIRKNWSGGSPGSAAGRGQALVQGLIRCGKCGGTMYVRYRKDVRPSGVVYTEPAYTCVRARSQFGVPMCQTVAATKVDRVVRDVFLRALEPAKLEVSLEALQRLDEQSRAAERHWELRLDRARYESSLAQRQYDSVEPENRIVARELERRWNERLEALQKLQTEFAQWKQKRQENWTAEEIQELRELVKDVRVVWDAATTTHEERKNLLRVLIDEVQVRTDRERRRMELRILWRGEVQTVHEVPWSARGPSPQYEVVDRVERWVAEGASDAEIAQRLNQQGLRPRRRGIFTPRRIGELRSRFGIVSRWRGQHAPGAVEDGWCSMPEAKEKLGVCKDTILAWIDSGLVEAKHSENGLNWWVRLSEKDLARLKGGWNPEEDWTVEQVAAHFKVAQTTVYGWVYKGWLPARALKIGPKHRLAIPREAVENATRKPRGKSSALCDSEDAS